MQEKRVVAITGASAGVGRAMALRFARAGDRVALIGRSAAGVESTRREIDSFGGESFALAADVASWKEIEEVADAVVRRWGKPDVWINNAMVTLFAPIADTTPDEYRRVTDVVYLGTVHGTMAALKHMRARDRGTIIQIGSALSYRAIPLQGAYCGGKAAVRAFTDSLRAELIHDKSHIRVSMLQLPAVNTPQFDWARNKFENRARPLPPVFQPEAIAEIAYRCAAKPCREIWIGWPTLKLIAGSVAAPGVLDRYLASNATAGQFTDERESSGHVDNLFEPAPTGHVIRGRFGQEAKPGVMAFQPALLRAGAALAGIALLILAVLGTCAIAI